MPTPITLLFAISCFVQEPPAPPIPPEPPRPPPAGSGPVLDDDLRTAREVLLRARGYRFHAEGHLPLPLSAADALARAAEDVEDVERPPPEPPANPAEPREPEREREREEAVARALERRPDAVEFRIDGTFELGKPLRLQTGELEAFRSGDVVAFRTKARGSWDQLPVLAHPPTPAEPGPRGGGASEAERRGLLVAGRLPAPHELLIDLERRITSCTRLGPEDPRTGGAVTYECRLAPDARRELLGLPASPEQAAGAPPPPESLPRERGSLRIVMHKGAIDQIIVETLPPPPEPVPGRRVRAEEDLFLHYKVTDVGAVELEVPDDALRLLERR